MERDFLGLNSKEPVVVVKEETNNDGGKDPGYGRGGRAHWPFLSQVSAVPQFMSFKAAQDDRTKKMVPDSFLSSVSAGAFDPCQKQTTCESQKNFNHDRQGGIHFSLTAYPRQRYMHSVHRPHDTKMISVTSQGISVPMSNPYLKNHFTTTGQNFSTTTMKHTAPPSALPVTGGSIAGITEPWNNVKTSGSPSQLTIFYAGTVNVYDDISPEKAQALMLLAGNSCSNSSSAAQPKAQAPSAKLAAEDGVPVNQRTNIPPPALSSPLSSVSSHTGSQSVSGSTSTDELMSARTTGRPTSPVNKMEAPETANAVRSVAATSMIPSAVPQARKASLARFLEKRKERVMSAAPYNFDKKSPEYGTPESNGVNFGQQGEQR
ncbi:protein TIFY 6B-like isoform X1 [Malus sylvestris]|uniref:protein TIFY 6B-like isoform X1 n=1 Tax=Malus sylvestris TaxID=3752 RepID=UPI0021ABBF64|nr:protein TIFY 6B-like isoform X1 [Malus sylvestris]